MDLDQLHTFLEIVRLKSFSKAAQTCYRTQPAISAQVRQLELELNTTLFERYGTRISLTVAGRILAEHAEQILALRRRAQDAINERISNEFQARLAMFALMLPACAARMPPPQPIPAVAEPRQCPAYPVPPPALLKPPAKTGFLPKMR